MNKARDTRLDGATGTRDGRASFAMPEIRVEIQFTAVI
jgi:hypothetical protein